MSLSKYFSPQHIQQVHSQDLISRQGHLGPVPPYLQKAGRARHGRAGLGREAAAATAAAQ